MRIEINSNTKTIKETYTKKEESMSKNDLAADEISILSMAIASKIYEMFDTEIQRDKMIDSIPLLIRGFLK